MNTHVGRIARRQVEMGDYTMPSTPVTPANESDADDDNGDASSSGTDEMST